MTKIQHHSFCDFPGTTGKIVILLIFLLATPCLKSQNNDSVFNVEASSKRGEKAIRAFNSMAYPRAVHIFKSLNQKEKLNSSEKGLLAVAYYRLNEPVKAAVIFSNIGEDRLSGNFLFSYAQVLQSLGRYRQADRVMKRYLSENPDDSRAREQVNTSEFVMQSVRNERYEIKPVNLNSSYSDFSPLIQNGVMYFISDRDIKPAIRRKSARDQKPFLNVFRAVPRGDAFSSPELFFSQFKTIFHDGPLCFNNTGTEVFLTRNTFHSVLKQKGKDDYNRLKIVHSSRDAQGRWTDPIDLPFNESGSSSGHPWLSPDNSRLYFASDRQGGHGGSDIWYVNQTPSGWGTPINAGANINTRGNEMFPFVDQQGNLYFTSDGHMGMGGLDLFVARNIRGEFVVKNMGYPINSNSDDFSIFLNLDGTTGYFASNRPGGQGDDDIYHLRITNPVTFKEEESAKNEETAEFFKLMVIEQNSQAPIPGAIVGFLDNNGRYLGEVTSDEAGLLHINDTIKGKVTAMTAVEYYYPYEDTFTLENKKDTLYLMLRPMPAYGVYGQVTNASNGNPISGVTIIQSSSSQNTKTYTTNQEGKFRIRFRPYSNFRLEFRKDGFESIQTEYSTTNRNTGYINLNQSVNLKMKPDG
jgi:tetratricopeptide (TPR) repeat protein